MSFGSLCVPQAAAATNCTKGISSCLKFLEAVPWNEGEEENLKRLFLEYRFDETKVLSRLSPQEPTDSPKAIGKKLIFSAINGIDGAKGELRKVVAGLLSNSAGLLNNFPGLWKEDLYNACNCCLGSLLKHFRRAAADPSRVVESPSKRRTGDPLAASILKEVDGLIWLFELLLQQHMAEEFVRLWAEQEELLQLHNVVSPVVRHEISRISAAVFIAVGRGKLQCPLETRSGVLIAWFRPTLEDFSWLKRSKKGLNVNVLEDALGRAMLTLPMTSQKQLFIEWLDLFSRQGKDCPNLGQAFQRLCHRSLCQQLVHITKFINVTDTTDSIL